MAPDRRRAAIAVRDRARRLGRAAEPIDWTDRMISRLCCVRARRKETQRMHLTAVPHEPTEFEMIQLTRGALDLLGVRLAVDVLYLLAGGTRRYSELLYDVGEVSKKTLTHALRRLERDGLVSRRAFAEVPPRVEYSLTQLGWALTGVLMDLYEWATTHMPEVEAARSEAAAGATALAA
jgi:DNA-binding HxlR family transcriptional regulator